MRRSATHRASRLLYTGIGFLWAGLGVVGAFVPLLPSTVFLIVAAWCFGRGDPRLYRRLRRHPLFIPVREWRAGRGLSAAAKVGAVSSIALTFSLSIVLAVESPLLKVVLAGLALGLSVYLLRQPTSKPLGPN